MKKKNRELYWKIKEDVCLTAKEMMKFGLVIGSAGNVSARVPDKEELFITPSQVDYKLLQPHQIVLLDFMGKQIGGDWTPSSEKIMHIEVYKSHQNVNAVIHTHSKYASILSIIGKEIPVLMEEIVNIIGGPIKLSKFAQVGSKELGVYAIEALGDRKAILLQNHGVLVCGKNLFEALRIAQIVEEIAEIYYHALLLGEGKIIPIPESALKFQRIVYEALNKVPRKIKRKISDNKKE
ncbi:MAG: class II aldolase/adducin family protein [Promethearchaeota archaeon]